MRSCWPIRALAAVLGAALLSCGGDPGPGTLAIEATAASAPAENTWVEFTLTAEDEFGEAGSGTVDVTITHGKLYGAMPGAGATVYLEKGKGTIKAACWAGHDKLCVGKQVVHASWNGIDAYAPIEFTKAD